MRDAYWWKKRAQKLAHQVSRERVLVLERPKHGISDVADIARRISVLTIVDVGANWGQSAIRFRAAFPHARILSLEPVDRIFGELRHRTRGLNIETYSLALGAQVGKGTMFLTGQETTNSLIRPPADVCGIEEVDIDTLDNFLSQRQLESVDVLKVDVEGYDLEVLAGGAESLSTGIVKSVLVEVGFQPGDDRHPPINTVAHVMDEYGFSLLGIYEQTPEWTGEPRIRFANALFVRR